MAEPSKKDVNPNVIMRIPLPLQEEWQAVLTEPGVTCCEVQAMFWTELIACEDEERPNYVTRGL